MAMAETDDVVRLSEEIEQLKVALASRDVIGQAKGILMERHRMTAEQAFHELRRVSQHTNRRLADIAEQVALTGQLP